MSDDIFQEKPETENIAAPADRDIPSVATPGRQQYLLGGFLFLVAIIAVIFIVIDSVKKNEPKSFIEPEEITFRTPGAQTPYIEPDVPEEPLEPPPALEPPPPAYDPAAMQRELAMQQEALRMAKEEQARMEKRIASPQVILDKRSGNVMPANSGSAATGGSGMLGGGDGGDPNLAFARQYGNQETETATASQLQNLPTLISQGTMIEGILETAIQSDLPGPIRAIVSENVFSFDGSRLLIPKGAKLIGSYRSGLVRGQSRVFVIWNRLIRADGVSINIGSYGTDSLGRSGLAGDLDTHFFERFSASVLLSLIDAGLQMGVKSLDNTDSASIALDTGNEFSRSSEIALENSIAIPPTINIDQGKRIQVFVNKDLDFSQVKGNLPRQRY